MEGLPPGFRFHPTDEELITCYLCHKVSDVNFTSKAITDVDFNKCEPWDLPGKASMGEKEWYFFSLRDRKYPTGLRTNRATEAGYWKTTGKDKEIFRGDALVGMKKTLVFYQGRAPKGEKSNWVMHEYRLENKHPYRPSKEEWVVCRVFHKNSAAKKPQQAPSSSQLSLDSPCDTNSIVNEFGDIELPNLNSIAPPSGGVSNFLPQSQNFDNTFNNMHFGGAEATLPSLSWPSNLVSPNLCMNSLLLKAIQLRSYQTRDTTSSVDISCMPQTLSHFGTDNTASSFQASTSRVMDSGMPQDQQQEQPFNLDSMWYVKQFEFKN